MNKPQHSGGFQRHPVPRGGLRAGASAASLGHSSRVTAHCSHLRVRRQGGLGVSPEAQTSTSSTLFSSDKFGISTWPLYCTPDFEVPVESNVMSLSPCAGKVSALAPTCHPISAASRQLDQASLFGENLHAQHSCPCPKKCPLSPDFWRPTVYFSVGPSTPGMGHWQQLQETHGSTITSARKLASNALSVLGRNKIKRTLQLEILHEL